MSIEVGQIYPNYPAICKALNEKPTSGMAKILQVENWKRYFTWSNEHKRKFEITEILQPIETMRKRERESLWLSGIKLQVLNQLANNTINVSEDRLKYNELIFTTIDGSINYGLCNNNLRTLRKMKLTDFPEIVLLPETTAAESDLELARINTEVWRKLNSIFTDVLKSLAKKLLITYNYKYFIKKEGEDYPRIATASEENEINALTLQLLNTPTYIGNTLESLFKVGLNNKFFQERTEWLKPHGYESCKKAHQVGFTELQLEYAASYMRTLEEITGAKYDLNAKAYKFFNNKLLEEDSITYDADILVVNAVLEHIIPIIKD